jgi:mRNA-degrading endonuclease RelE of RelBE toxin-antitoxin system
MNSNDDIKCHFRLLFSPSFCLQILEFDEQTKRVVEEKIKLVRLNPFHFKSLTHSCYRLFRVRITFQRRKLRLVYMVGRHTILFVGFLNRANDYDDLERILKKCGINLNNLQ